MDKPANVSSQNRPCWYLLDGCVSTRNRRLVGSNPTSGSTHHHTLHGIRHLTVTQLSAVDEYMGWILDES
jgi:hypothetical protein